MAAGIPDELFWGLDLHELRKLLERLRLVRREAYLRAGLVAATIVNVHRRRGAGLVHPQDFLRERPRPQDYMDPAAAVQFMNRWAQQHNASLKEEGK